MAADVGGAEPVAAAPTIGFIGVGVMGAPMAQHLARAGHHLVLHDADGAAAQALARALGGAASVRATPREVAAASDGIVVTMLPDGKAVQQVALGEHGLIHAMRPGSLLLDCSSAEPWLTEATARALAEHDVSMVDAPVSGAQQGAREATLVFMVGGAPRDVACARPLLDAMGRSVFHLGRLGAGHAMKCLNNGITAATLATTAEALVAGKRYGLDPAAMIDVLNESTGGSWITRTHFRQRIFNRRFDDPFKLGLMGKDIGIAAQLAREAGAPVPMLALAQQLWRMAEHAHGAGASVSELVRWVENQSGTQLRPSGEPASNERTG